MKRYKLSHRAKVDLDRIWDYSEEKWGAQQAAAYHLQIRNAIAMICERPDLGLSDELLRTGYRRRSAGSHVIFYKVGEEIEVIRILHQNMDAKSHLN
jgi:toxin ParE1/3/4